LDGRSGVRGQWRCRVAGQSLDQVQEGDNSKLRRNNSSSRSVVAEPDQILFFCQILMSPAIPRRVAFHVVWRAAPFKARSFAASSARSSVDVHGHHDRRVAKPFPDQVGRQLPAAVVRGLMHQEAKKCLPRT